MASMASSHLTPLVFRQLLRGRALTHRQCLRLVRAGQSTSTPTPTPTQEPSQPPPHLAGSSRRSIFSWGAGDKQGSVAAKARKIDPGYTELARLDELLRMKVRPLEADMVNAALEAFFTHKYRTQRPITDSQIHLALVACNHLLATGDKTLAVHPDKLVLALKSLQRVVATSKPVETAELARIFYHQLEASQSRLVFQNASETFATEVILPFTQILCDCDEGTEARDVLSAALERSPDVFRESRFWKPVLTTFIAKKDDGAMQHTLQLMEQHGVPLGAELQLAVLEAFAAQGDFGAAQQWHETLARTFPAQSVRADAVFLDLCIAQQKLAEGEAAFRRLLHTEPDKSAWDIILRWAAAKRKGADEVERMMDVMVKRSAHRPDVATINGLIALANGLRDPYTAERYVALAAKRGIYLNGETYALQMAYRLDVGDLAGAYTAFQQTLSDEVPDGSDIPQIQRLVQQLCAVAPEAANNVHVVECLKTLDERRVPYAPATVVALCRLRLAQGKIRSLINLLHAHAYNLNQEQRQPIMAEFMAYIVDRDQPAKAAWDAYCILREVFPELDNDMRTQIMIDFFARGRSDIAIHVFGHMRQAEVTADRPGTATYALCFQGVGHAADERSFDLVYNMLKLDAAIEPDTHLRNAIMLAQIGCGFRGRALEIWDDIVFSHEGPDYNSIAIALYAVETLPQFTDRGQEIWARLQSYHVQPTPQIYVAYVGALAGQDKLPLAFDMVAGMQAAVGQPPDATTLGVLYNAAFASQRDEVRAWASQKYPDAWAALEALGTTDKGLYKINRQLVP